MKYRFISLILTVALQLSGATVALLGRGEAGRNLADRIFAAGSDLEFVERDRIAAILRERRLNETQLDSASVRHLASLLKADLFVLADARKDGGEGRLLIFESNCGFRLADELLPAEGTEQAALELIRSKQTLVAAPENALFLASTGIRDRALPRSSWIEAHRTADEFMRRLLRVENLLLLEREELNLLVQERKLTGSFARLAAASRLLALELDPGSTPDGYRCRVRLYSPKGKLLFSAEAASTDHDPAGVLLEKLAARLRCIPPPAIPGDRKTEAARFFEEARWYGSRTPEQERQMLARYRTAWLLDPENHQYRQVLVDKLRINFRYPVPPLSDGVERLELAAAVLGPEFGRPEFYREEYAPAEQLWGQDAVSQTLAELHSHPRNAFQPEQLTVVRGIADAFRRHLQLALKLRSDRLRNEKNPEELAAELPVWISEHAALLEPSLYFDDAQFRSEGCRLLDQMLEMLDIFRRAGTLHAPAYLTKDYDFLRIQIATLLQQLPRQTARQKSRFWAKKFRTGEPAGFQLIADWLDFQTTLGENPPKNRQALRKMLLLQFPRWKQHMLPKQRNSQLWLSMTLEAFNSAGLRFNPEDFARQWAAASAETAPQIAQAPHRGSIGKKPHNPLPALADSLRQKSYPEQLRTRIPLLNQPHLLFDPEPEQLAELNPEFEFHAVYPEQTAGLPFPIAAQGQAATRTLYLLLHRSNALTLHQIDTKGKSRRLNAVMDPEAVKFFNPLRNHKAPFQLQISDGRAFLPWNDGLLEIPFDGSPFRRHTGFSGPVVGAEYRNGRLWVATEGVILSASPKGGDRQIALSKFDETDRLFPDRESRFNFRLRGFFAEPGNGNRFLLVENDQLTRFDADRRTLTPLLRSREFLSTPECVIQRSGMKITIMNFSNSGRTCSFGWWDPVRQRGSFLRCGPPPERREPDSATPFRRFEESLPLRGSACLLEGILYTAGGFNQRSLILNIKSPEKTPGWFMPRLNALFPADDNRSVLLVTRYRVLKAAWKQSGGE